MTTTVSQRPLIIQSDKSILLEVDSPAFEAARDALAGFADLEKSPEHIHTYRITPLSLWNAASSGLGGDAVIEALKQYSKYPLPANVETDIREYLSRYGRLKLVRQGADLALISDDVALIREIARHREIQPHILGQADPHRLTVDPARRGHIKQALLVIGYPAEDLAGYVDGAALSFELRHTSRHGREFSLRGYQTQAADAFHAGGGPVGGSGVIVLPCGAGKTIVGIAAMHKLQMATLILTTNTVAARQWMDELLDKTSLQEDQVGEYSGLRKQVRPVTVATYQIMTYGRKLGKGHNGKGSQFPHLALFNEQNWGLIIYDEVHLLPAPVFRVTAEIQARRRLGLTATLVREDGRQGDVFSLIGPKKYDAPWKDLEQQGWIAVAECHEVRIPLPDEMRLDYALADGQERYRLAAENPRKLDVLAKLVEKHSQDSILIIGMYLSQLQHIAREYHWPLITGQTGVRERQRLYDAFRRGEIRCLVVSKVGNFAIDLPDANVAIQVSGTFGSRQEEAQRLGRILRPKEQSLLAHFYGLVSRDSVDQSFAAKRQLFLTEQGYHYEIIYEDEIDDWHPRRHSVVDGSCEA